MIGRRLAAAACLAALLALGTVTTTAAEAADSLPFDYLTLVRCARRRIPACKRPGRRRRRRSAACTRPFLPPPCPCPCLRMRCCTPMPPQDMAADTLLTGEMQPTHVVSLGWWWHLACPAGGGQCCRCSRRGLPLQPNAMHSGRTLVAATCSQSRGCGPPTSTAASLTAATRSGLLQRRRALRAAAGRHPAGPPARDAHEMAAIISLPYADATCMLCCAGPAAAHAWPHVVRVAQLQVRCVHACSCRQPAAAAPAQCGPLSCCSPLCTHCPASPSNTTPGNLPELWGSEWGKRAAPPWR